MAWNALTDPLPRYDPKSQELCYNNWTDRRRIELPQPGDPAASGVVSLNIDTIPPSGIPVSVDRWNGDSLMIWSASGTAAIETFINSSVYSNEIDPTVKNRLKKRFFYNGNGDISSIRMVNAAAASGDPCLVQTFSYNASQDVDYITESIGTW